jgi:predicted N-acetyltransferase YhbS
MFGPFGVLESVRGQGVGRALLLSALNAMATIGYAYAVIGDPSTPDFYQRVVPAVEIPDSVPGVYLDRLAD